MENWVILRSLGAECEIRAIDRAMIPGGPIERVRSRFILLNIQLVVHTNLSREAGSMENKFTYGFVITVVGMGGTLLSLWFITFVVGLLKKVFPYREEQEKNGKEIV